MNPKNPKTAPQTPRPRRWLMCPADLKLFFAELLSSERGVQKHWQTMRDALGKKKGQRINIREFAEYEGIDLADVIETINAAP